MNPIIVVSLISGVALVIAAYINYLGNKKTKDEVIEVGKRVDGRMDLLLKTIRAEGVADGKKQQSAIITEEATRVAGVSLEAHKRAEATKSPARL